jgi:type IV fimbrial biogenesis protein FimT
MNQNALHHGFTLIELMVAVTLFGLLLALAVPMYVSFLANAQVRNAAEAMLNGVVAAQTAAVNNNGQVQLIVSPATGWVIQFVNPDTSAGPGPVVPAPFVLTAGAPQANIVTTPVGATEITFDAFGRIVPNPDTSQTISCINVTNNANASARALRVVVSNSNQATGTKLCDPAVAQTEPQACPLVACG